MGSSCHRSPEARRWWFWGRIPS